MNVAILQPRISYFTGGSEKTALRHIEYLSRNHALSIDVYTVFPPHMPLSQEYVVCKNRAGEKIRFHEIDIPESYLYIYAKDPDSDHTRWDSESLLFSTLVAPLLTKEKHDCLLSYYLVDALFKPLNLPNVVYLGGFPREDIPLYRSFIRFCDAVFANSEYVLQNWESIFKYHEDMRKYVLKKGVDAFDEERTQNPFDQGGFNVVYVGRLIERKGVHVLIDSFKQFAKTVPDAHLWIVGDGPERKYLESASAHLSVHFMGTRSNVYDFYAHADICVFPSLTGEGMMTTACEAMMCGAPIIVTTGNGNESFIEQGVNGMLVSPGDAQALVESLHRLHQQPMLRKTFGQVARQYAEKHFSWKVAIEDLHQKLVEIVTICKQ